MGISLILFAQGFISNEVNASSNGGNDAQHDIQECKRDSDKHREPKELISIFDKTTKLYSEKGYTNALSYIEAVKSKLKPEVDSLNGIVRSQFHRYRPNEIANEERTKECLSAVIEVEKQYKQYLANEFKGNEAIVEIVSKNEPPKYQAIGQMLNPKDVSTTYTVKYIHKDEKLISTRSAEVNILKSEKSAPEFKAGDVLKIKRTVEKQVGYPLAVQPQDIEKVASYNPS